MEDINKRLCEIIKLFDMIYAEIADMSTKITNASLKTLIQKTLILEILTLKMLIRNTNPENVDPRNTNPENIDSKNVYKFDLFIDPEDPPNISYYEDGKIKMLLWKRNGKYYRKDDLPTQIVLYPNGKVKTEYWLNEKGVGHRLGNKPACINYNEDGSIKEMEFCINCKYSIDNIWDSIEYYYDETGNKVCKKDKYLYHIEEPVENIVYKEMYRNDKLIERRAIGPDRPILELWDPITGTKVEEKWE